MSSRWNVSEAVDTAGNIAVFSGGACNILSKDGALLRNQERDRINDWLTEKDVFFFDPQIHPATHGVEYNYAVHHKIEMAAREAAKINLYEVSPRTFGGVTSIELAVDTYDWREATVIYYSDADPNEDLLPPYSKEGHPQFQPDGYPNNEAALKAHYREYLKNGNNMRKYVVRFAQDIDTLTVTMGQDRHEHDAVIQPDRMHAVDMFEAIVNALDGNRVNLHFDGGPETRDAKGNPRFILPENPPEMQMKSFLDSYIDEGNMLRRRIAKMLEVSVFTRIVFTQKAAIAALEELLTLKKVLK